MNLSWLRNLRFLRSADAVRAAIDVSRVSRIGTVLRQVPIVRLMAGSAVGIVIIDTWNKGVGTISEVFGTSDEVSAVMLGAVAALAVAMAVSSVISLRRGRRW